MARRGTTNDEPEPTWVGHYLQEDLIFGTEEAVLPRAYDAAAKALNAALPRKPASVRGAVMNLTKGIIGAGMLAFPNALRKSSMLIGVVGIMFIGFVSVLGFLAIGRACRLARCTSYREAVQRAGGPATAIDVMTLLECLVTCVGYIILVGDYVCIGLDGMLPGLNVADLRVSLMTAISLTCILPLCLLGEFNRLAASSGLGLLAMFYGYLLVVGSAVVPGGPVFAEDWKLAGVRSTTFPALTTMVSAFGCHYLAPTIWADCVAATGEEKAAWSRFQVITLSAFSLAGFIFLSFGVSGYLLFGENVRSNVLTNYPAHHHDGSPVHRIFLCWLLLALAYSLSYPVVFRSAREVLASALQLQRQVSGSISLKTGLSKMRLNLPWVLMVAGLILLTNVVSIFFSDIGKVLSLRGALLGCNISFIFPGFLVLSAPRSRGDILWRLVGGALIGVGLLGGMLGLYFAISNW
mmetsp:Transcript_29660/g.64578  ORF Transcript_29660/g.64578 Transcript_29660/m.64578 type:complete len:465 (-) Transcript_29660:337-1731(-)